MSNLDVATGQQLDMLAMDRYALVRKPGESDAHLRMRIRRMAGADDGVVRVGPIKVYDRDELDKIHAMMTTAMPTRSILESIINMQNSRGGGAVWGAGTSEQVIYEVAEYFKAEGVLVDGIVLDSGQRTNAWVDRNALDVWRVAMALILDDGDD